ncbi:hypothetical protein WL99_22695 [Burkholderia cepacia]|uniref:hypothetical protein n=1 Tax=Burkholderia cepacia TaxID=292 RepID=UPI00075B2BC4|nr:hypothetical protein [Burkholderia cepacia]KWH25901.1 hypothetical protein WL99_22695 [Burkholderia cepacia]
MRPLPAERTPHWLNKVPDFALSLRIGKIMSTTVGENGADFLAVNVGLGRIVTRIAIASRLAMAPWMQLRTHCDVPWICQPTVVLVNIVGTRITDLPIVGVNVSLRASAPRWSSRRSAICSRKRATMRCPVSQRHGRSRRSRPRSCCPSRTG